MPIPHACCTPVYLQLSSSADSVLKILNIPLLRPSAGLAVQLLSPQPHFNKLCCLRADVHEGKGAGIRQRASVLLCSCRGLTELLSWFRMSLKPKWCFADKSLVTVWSAPNYCYRCGNVASILCFDDNLEREIKYFTETEENSTMMAPRNTVPYFL